MQRLSAQHQQQLAHVQVRCHCLCWQSHSTKPHVYTDGMEQRYRRIAKRAARPRTSQRRAGRRATSCHGCRGAPRPDRCFERSRHLCRRVHCLFSLLYIHYQVLFRLPPPVQLCRLRCRFNHNWLPHSKQNALHNNRWPINKHRFVCRFSIISTHAQPTTVPLCS